MYRFRRLYLVRAYREDGDRDSPWTRSESHGSSSLTAPDDASNSRARSQVRYMTSFATSCLSCAQNICLTLDLFTMLFQGERDVFHVYVFHRDIGQERLMDPLAGAVLLLVPCVTHSLLSRCHSGRDRHKSMH